ncbi:galactose-1-phosphate uridylyltransferase [Streptomyces varsoviensis]|uniref:galactose-1-phosphate uridylyltransferase n=1 Tax=Streptomyces varsoviensis TaxID=67373 RepID=UPI0006625ABD|nr:hypothetical protein [Streptomyces varsoviensis]
MAELRRDPLTGARVMVRGSRQGRPRTRGADCPFCPGGLEAPEPYRVRRFANRWPALEAGRCEVLLYSPDHAATWATMGEEQAVRAVGLWDACTRSLGALPDVGYVLLFENRGAEAGATVDHPHGQAFGLAEVPPTAAAHLGGDGGADGCSLCAGPAKELLVAEEDEWWAWVPRAPIYPYTVRVAPRGHLPGLPACDARDRLSLARLLSGVVGRFERFFGGPAPYFLWVHQHPTDGATWPRAHLYVEIVSVWRSPGVPRYIAAGELGSGIFFTPLEPEVAAERLREA